MSDSEMGIFYVSNNILPTYFFNFRITLSDSGNCLEGYYQVTLRERYNSLE